MYSRSEPPYSCRCYSNYTPWLLWRYAVAKPIRIVEHFVIDKLRHFQSAGCGSFRFHFSSIVLSRKHLPRSFQSEHGTKLLCSCGRNGRRSKIVGNSRSTIHDLFENSCCTSTRIFYSGSSACQKFKWTQNTKKICNYVSICSSLSQDSNTVL